MENKLLDTEYDNVRPYRSKMKRKLIQNKKRREKIIKELNRKRSTNIK